MRINEYPVNQKKMGIIGQSQKEGDEREKKGEIGKQKKEILKLPYFFELCDAKDNDKQDIKKS